MRFPTLFLLLIVTLHTSAQEAVPQIQTQWLNIRIQIQNRSKVVNALTNALITSKVDKKIIDNVKRASTDLLGHIDTLIKIDSISVSLAEMKNIRLIQAIQEVLIEIEKYPALKSTEEFASFQNQLEGCENLIAQAVNTYNYACSKYKRADLIFHRRNQQQSTEIKF